MLYSSDDIKKVIPHRYPFLLIDTIEMMDETKIIAKKCVSSNEMFFMGHFPNKQVMPGVLIVEALAQAGCFLLLSKEEYQNHLVYFTGIDQVRFKQQVVPGDVLKLEVELVKNRGNVYFADVKASCDDRVCVSGRIMCAVGEVVSE